MARRSTTLAWPRRHRDLWSRFRSSSALEARFRSSYDTAPTTWRIKLAVQYRGRHGRALWTHQKPSIHQTVTPYRVALWTVMVTRTIIRMTAIARPTTKPAFSTFLRLASDIWVVLVCPDPMPAKTEMMSVIRRGTGSPGRMDNMPAEGGAAHALSRGFLVELPPVSTGECLTHPAPC